MITIECTKDGLILGDLQALAEWKLYQLRKTALTTDKNRLILRYLMGVSMNSQKLISILSIAASSPKTR